MPPRLYSRYSLSSVEVDSAGRQYLTPRRPARYEDRSDNRTHVVTEGENLQVIAERYFPSFDRGAGLWWVIADFQPEPIHDPTIELDANRLLVIPSERFLVDRVFNEDLRP